MVRKRSTQENAAAPACCVKNEGKPNESYSHSLTGGCIVHPDQKTVIPFAPEAIVRQDGSTKNDCEKKCAETLSCTCQTKRSRGVRTHLWKCITRIFLSWLIESWDELFEAADKQVSNQAALSLIARKSIL